MHLPANVEEETIITLGPRMAKGEVVCPPDAVYGGVLPHPRLAVSQLPELLLLLLGQFTQLLPKQLCPLPV